MLSVAIVVEGQAECPKLALAMKSRAGGTRWIFRGVMYFPLQIFGLSSGSEVDREMRVSERP